MKGRDASEHERLMERLQERSGTHADEVGQRAQTRHQQLAAKDDSGAEAMWEVARAAARVSQPRLDGLRLVTITTNCAGSFAAWIQSLLGALDDAGWRPGRGPDIEVLRVANDADPSVDAAHRMVEVKGVKIQVIEIDPARRPLPLAEARPFAFRCVRELGWLPSPSMPVWSLDEDFRFQTLVPSPRRMFVRRSGGPLLHRLDALVASLVAQNVDVIVGGNTGAAPVPSLGLLLGQLTDLAEDTNPGEWPAAPLELLSQRADAYYDLAESQRSALHVPLARAWWREDGVVDTAELVRRLQAGLPVTRPALAMPLRHPPSAWASNDHAVVAGGNTVLLSTRALDARFRHVRQGSLISRRADTTWVIDARVHGAKVVRACLPLLHDRQRGAHSPSEAGREALADALGVGVYQAMIAGDPTEARVRALAEMRLAALRTCLGAAESIARRACIRGVALDAFADWIANARDELVLPRQKPLSFRCCG